MDTNNVYIYGRMGNYMYTSWTGYVAPSSWGDINSMTMFDNNIFWLACDYDNILFTTNAGANWSVKKPPQYGNEFLVGSYSIDRQTVYMVGQSAGYPTAGRILQSIDGGNNWTLQYSGNVNLYKISFAK
ncbi:MAG: hypothetical protein NTV87_12440 [Ignavibacteriae bacterium]|nr:hypothetical protein [Ignavibacteriota bacterium]